MTINKIFKILFLPFLLSVLLAMVLGKEKAGAVLGNNIQDEYLFLFLCATLHEIQVFTIAKLHNT